MITIKIDLPFKVSTNKIYSGCHWTQRKKYKDIMLLTTIDFKKAQSIENKIDISYVFFFKSHPLDSENCSFMAKIITDCMVKHRIIQDDSIKYVRKVSLESRKSDNKTDYVELEITEC